MAKPKIQTHTGRLAAAFAASALALLLVATLTDTSHVQAAFTKTTVRKTTKPQTSGTAASIAPARAVPPPTAAVQRSSASSRQATEELNYDNAQALAKTVCDCLCKKRGLNLCPVQYQYEPSWGNRCPYRELYSVEASPDTDCSVLHGVPCYGMHPGLGVGDVFYGNLDFCEKYVRAVPYYQ